MTDRAVTAELAVVGSWEGAVEAVTDALYGPAPSDDDPFRMPLLVVPSKAHARAVAQRVARRDGVGEDDD